VRRASAWASRSSWLRPARRLLRAEVHELDRDPAVELLVVAGEHHAHRAAAELAEDEEAADAVALAGQRGLVGRTSAGARAPSAPRRGAPGLT
jgi:hypothetical protein